VIEITEARPSTEASSEFARELELTIHKGEDPVQDVLLIKIREDLPECQDPSPSVAAINKSFGTSYHAELLSVGYEVAGIRDGASKILTLWKSPMPLNDTGEGASEQTTHSLGQNFHDSGKEPCTSSKKTFVSLDKGSGKKVTIKDLVRKVHDFVCPLVLNFTIFRLWLCLAIFQNLRIFFDHIQPPRSRITRRIML
jgi:hypothetical protein